MPARRPSPTPSSRSANRPCHPDRSRSLSAANRSVKSRDPGSNHPVLPPVTGNATLFLIADRWSLITDRRSPCNPLTFRIYMVSYLQGNPMHVPRQINLPLFVPFFAGDTARLTFLNQHFHNCI